MVPSRIARPSALAETGGPDAEALRALCCALLVDLPPSARRALMLHCPDRTRRAGDLGQWRTALFETVARFHGAAAAHDRLAAWDARTP